VSPFSLYRESLKDYSLRECQSFRRSSKTGVVHVFDSEFGTNCGRELRRSYEISSELADELFRCKRCFAKPFLQRVDAPLPVLAE